MVRRSRSTCWGSWLQRAIRLLLVALIGVTLSAPLAPVHAQSGITTPAEGSAVNGDVTIIGTAVIEPFQKYELHYKQEPSGDDAFIYFAGGTSQVVNGPLGVWAAAGLPPGTYSLRLRVVKADGNYAEFFTRNISINQNSAPTATATSTTPTATPIPTFTFTPAPQPTTAVGAVEQPAVEGDLPTATPAPPAAAGSDNSAAGGTDSTGTTPILVPTPEPAADNSVSLTRELGEALAFEKLRTQFWNGVRYSALLCIGLLLIFGGKRLFQWAWTQFR